MPFDGLDDTVALSEDVHNNILNALAHEVEDICVEAPAGAGKTHTIEDCAALATLHLGRSVLVALSELRSMVMSKIKPCGG